MACLVFIAEISGCVKPALQRALTDGVSSSCQLPALAIRHQGDDKAGLPGLCHGEL